MFFGCGLLLGRPRHVGGLAYFKFRFLKGPLTDQFNAKSRWRQRTLTTDTDISPVLSDLPAREREVLTFICRGYADKQIATELKVSIHTIRNHVSTIYSKLNVHKRGAAIIWARERGLIRNDSSNPKRHGE